MARLIVGFDSAWTRKKSGGIVGVVQLDDGSLSELGEPSVANFEGARSVISAWRDEVSPAATIVMLDQPTIVKNTTGQRPVENLVGAPVSRRYGGVQPANTGKTEMFGSAAPVWGFLEDFGGAADPLDPLTGTRIYETYPVLALIALGWILPDHRSSGRLPKYNPERRKTFSLSDWQYVCGLALAEFERRQLSGIAEWILDVARNSAPRKRDQDCLDSCLCLLVALHFAEERECLMVGELETGYMLVPHGVELHSELMARCEKTNRSPEHWLRRVRLQ